jgi:PadR family transcriptional regulator, regulatory protein PadR
MQKGHCQRHGGERPCSCAMGNLYRFVEPVILYMLAKMESAHGYELAGELKNHTLTDTEIDRGALYRTLQRLEANGHVESEWDTSNSGPARHVYKITDTGREHLREWAVVLDNLTKSMESFVEDVNNLREQQRSMDG